VKIVFFGTSHFAARILTYLLQKRERDCVAIVSRPDKPRGRSLHLLSPPVKECAQKIAPHLPIYQPHPASTPAFVEMLKQLQPDLFVVVAYGEILKPLLLQVPRLGSINIHASLLPKYRGAAPMQRCLMAGEKETGVTIIDMVAEMDAGEMLAIEKIPVSDTMTFGELDLSLSEIAAPLLLQVIHDLEKGSVKRTPQNPAQVTFAPKVTAAEEEINWKLPATTLHNLIRALSPSPGAWCWVGIGSEKKRLKIKRSEVVSQHENPPGKNLIFNSKEWVVTCGEKSLRLLEVQLEGKKSLPITDFLKGLHSPPNIIFS
jgi:methionyl-tRNA formyltransferase